MRQPLMQMITCRWTAHRIQRYLDADPSAPLTRDEIVRLEAHLAICEKCTQVAAEHRALHGALALFWGDGSTDVESALRLRAYLADLTRDEPH